VSSRLHRELVILRSATSVLGLATPVLGACRALARGRSLEPRWSLGSSPGAFAALDEAVVDAFLRRVAQQQSQARLAPCWFTAADEPTPPTLAINLEATAAGSMALARGALADPLPARAALAEMIRDAAEAFGAPQAYLEDEALVLRYFSRRATERAIAATPPELRRFVPDPVAFADNGDLELLVMQEHDWRRVPVGVFWINYWSAEVVAALGATRVREAGWAELIEAANGALVLIATHDPLDTNDAAHLEIVRRLVTHLGLRAAQDAARR